MSVSEFLRLLAPQAALEWPLRLGFVLLLSVLHSVWWDIAGNGRLDRPLDQQIIGICLNVAPLAIALLWTLQQLVAAERKIAVVSSMDPVTGLLNKSRFLHRVSMSMPQTGVLLLLDLDHFRNLNSQRGHHVGDLCLLALAQRFRELTRHTDIVGRLDGATFAVYLPGAPSETAQEIGQRFSEGLQIVTTSGVLKVTMSVGAVMADGKTPLSQLIRNANDALDLAKMQGKARCVMHHFPIAI